MVPCANGANDSREKRSLLPLFTWMKGGGEGLPIVDLVVKERIRKRNFRKRNGTLCVSRMALKGFEDNVLHVRQIESTMAEQIARPAPTVVKWRRMNRAS